MNEEKLSEMILEALQPIFTEASKDLPTSDISPLHEIAIMDDVGSIANTLLEFRKDNLE